MKVENVIGRIKRFKALNIPWRHELDLHPIVFHVIAQLVARDLHDHPIQK